MLAPRHIFNPERYELELSTQHECVHKEAHFAPQTREEIRTKYKDILR